MEFEEAKQKVIDAIIDEALIYHKEADIKLSSGKMSQYYLNMKKITLSPHWGMLIGQLFYDKIKDRDIDAIGGLTLGADPIAYATGFYAYMKSKLLNVFIVRKEQKQYGAAQTIEGPINTMKNLCIVEDVITTGRSSSIAIERVLEAGLNPHLVVALVNRDEGGIENIKKAYNIDVEYIIHIDEILKKAKYTDD